jgi:hypothetical protein
VLNQLLGDTGYVRRFSCKDVDVLPKKAGERIFLVGIEADLDPSGLG